MGIPAGSVVLVTGASSGIGAATAKAAARGGLRVALVARRKDRLAALVEELGADRALALEADVAQPEAAPRVVAATLERFGQLDVLVNNAGVMMLGPVDGAPLADWKAMFEVNVLGLMYMTHAALPVLKQQQGGHVVNISSVSGRVVSARSAVYSATKFAVGAFSEGLRQELVPHGVRVTTIEPGVVATELADHITDAAIQKSVKDWAASMIPLSPEDVAHAILYAIAQPEHVAINQVLLRPRQQAM